MNDIFISYSRKDTDFVRRLFDALEEQQHQSWVDWKGIDYSAKWWEEICSAIERANNFVLIISPDALNSKYCHDEITHARKFNKRIIPFIYVDLDEEQWEREPLAEQALDNWTYLRSLQFISYPKLNDFDKAVAALVETAKKDPEYIQAHTELLAAARAWVAAGKSPGFLLRDERLRQAEAWLKQAQAKNPAPTSEQQDYIAASRKLANTNLRRMKQFIAAVITLVTIVVIFAMASTILFNQARSTSHQIATANVVVVNALNAEATSHIQATNAAIERGQAQNAAITATNAEGAALYAQATAGAQADAAQQDARNARTEVAVAGATLTSVPPTLTAIAAAVEDAKIEGVISQELANASLQLGARQTTQALKIANDLVKTYPNKPLVYMGRGLIYAYSNQLENAIADYTKTVQLDPTFIMAYFNRAISYSQLNQTDKAITDYEKVLQFDPNYAPAYANLGTVYTSLNDYDKALANINAAIEIDPTSALTYYNRGVVHVDLEDYDKAMSDYDKAIELDPNYALAYNNRGLVYRSLSNFDKALADFNKTIEIDPTLSLGYFNRGIVYAGKGQYDSALDDLTKALELDPTFTNAYYNRALLYNLLEKYDDAINDFSKAIELFPKFTLAYMGRGTSYFAKEQYAEALADWDQYDALGGEQTSLYLQMRRAANAALAQTSTATARPKHIS